MPKYVDNFSNVTIVLAADVTATNTVTVPYPTGTTQDDFIHGLGGTAHKATMNDNDVLLAPTDFTVSFGGSNITVTNPSGKPTWVAGSTMVFQFDRVDGNSVVDLVFPVFAMTGIANGDLVTECFPGVDGYVEHIQWVQGVPVTTGSKLATINMEIGTTDVTGGTLALTSAACTPLGKVIEGSAVTGNNRITRKDKFSLEASAVTAFSEGSGHIRVRIRLDQPNAY